MAKQDSLYWIRDLIICCTLVASTIPASLQTTAELASCSYPELAANTTCPPGYSCDLPQSTLIVFDTTNLCGSPECQDVAQLTPVSIEIGAQVQVIANESIDILTGNNGFDLFRANSAEAWLSCNDSAATMLFEAPRGAPARSIEAYLQPGTNYLFSSANRGMLQSECRAGHRINLTLTTNCRSSANGAICSGRGACVVAGDGSTSCRCPVPYIGSQCGEIDECNNDPAVMRCLNGGTCMDANCTFSCYCPPGYTGMRCDVQVNPCDSFTCYNGGSCMSSSGSAYCACANGYTGLRCESASLSCTTVDRFANTTCPAVRTCPLNAVSTVWGVQNICPPEVCPSRVEQRPVVIRYDTQTTLFVSQIGVSATGSQDLHLFEVFSAQAYDNCDISGARELTPMPTQNFPVAVYNLTAGTHYLVSVRDVTLPQQECTRGWRQRVTVSGSCMNNGQICGNVGACAVTASLDQLECVCPPGINGQFCRGVDECFTGGNEQCLNGATCIDGTCSFSCACAAGYGGSRCERVELQCPQANCQNGATCLELPQNSFRCVCSQGYTGALCDQRINFCVNSPCVQGTCQNELTGFVCACRPDYTGATCDARINDCGNVVCANGGTPVDGIGVCTCQCMVGYTGCRCQTPYISCLAPEILANTTCPYGYQCVDNRTVTQLQWSISASICSDCQPLQLNSIALEVGTTLQFTADSAIGVPSGVLQIHQLRSLNEFTSCDITNALSTINLPIQTNYTLSPAVVRPGTLYFVNQDPTLPQQQCQRGLRAIVNVTRACYTPGVAGGQICAGRGACIETGNTNDPYRCRCPPGYLGPQCLEIDECFNQPCVNGGTCVDRTCDYQCLCPTNYIGRNCEVNATECPCQNGGVCMLAADRTFLGCLCQPGYTGALCNERVTSLPPPPPPPSFVNPPPAPIYPALQVIPPPPTPPPPPPPPGTFNQTSPPPPPPTTPPPPPPTTFPMNVTTPPTPPTTTPFVPTTTPFVPTTTPFVPTTTPFPGCTISNPCYNGGTCQDYPQSPDLFICMCPPTHTGRICENPLDPLQFNRTSSIIYPGASAQRNAFLIGMTIRSRELDGLLFYTGVPSMNNYVYAHLENGRVVVRVNMGGGEVVVRPTQHIYSQPLWKRLQVVVTFNVISVQLDSEAVSAIAPSSGFQTNGFIYLGYLNLTVPDNQMYARIGYSGCMTNVSIDGTDQDLIPLIRPESNITPCLRLPCMNMPCENMGTCTPSGPVEETFNCTCLPGFFGRRCTDDTNPCARRVCLNDGRCFNQNITANNITAFCRCAVGYADPVCGTNISTDVQEYFGDQFYGNSFVQHSFPAADVVGELSLEISIRPSTAFANGLILYTDEPGRDFFSMYLVNGILSVVFEFGSGPVVATASSQVLQPLVWYYITVTRSNAMFTLTVATLPYENDTVTYMASDNGNDALGVRASLAVGGFSAEEIMLMPPNAFVPRTSFTGCVTRLRVNSQPLPIIGGQAVGTCGPQRPCDLRPCASGSTCLESGAMFTCVCPPTRTGVFCETPNDACINTPCNAGATCIPNPDNMTDFDCACPLGYNGRLCNMVGNITYPEFTISRLGAGSYLQAPSSPSPNSFNTDLQLVFRATVGTGLLLLQENDTFDGDYVSLSIQNWQVVFIANMGGGSVITIRSSNRVTPGAWTNVTVARRSRTATMYVNGTAVTRDALGVLSEVNNLQPYVFVGGHPTIQGRPRRAAALTSLVGCVRFLLLDGTRYRLGTDRAGSTGSNVRECAAEFCEPPCQNNGTCVDPLDNGVFSCSCGPNFFGDLCETNFINPCELTNPISDQLQCNAASTCCLNTNSFVAQCICPKNATGMRCDQPQNVVVPRFLGTSFVSYDINIPREVATSGLIQINFTTTVNNSLLLYNPPLDGVDFFLAGINEGGYLEFVWNLGSGVGIATSTVRVDDGRWHFVSLNRVGQTTTITIDNVLRGSGTSPGVTTGLDRRSDTMFVGGLDNRPTQCIPAGYDNVNGRAFRQGFVGCINRLFFNMEIQLSGPNLGSASIQECTVPSRRRRRHVTRR